MPLVQWIMQNLSSPNAQGGATGAGSAIIQKTSFGNSDWRYFGYFNRSEKEFSIISNKINSLRNQPLSNFPVCSGRRVKI